MSEFLKEINIGKEIRMTNPTKIALVELISAILFNTGALLLTIYALHTGLFTEANPVTSFFFINIGFIGKWFITVLFLLIIFPFLQYVGNIIEVPYLVVYVYTILLVIFIFDFMHDFFLINGVGLI